MLAKRIRNLAPSPIRKIFDLAATIKDPVDLSLGEPDFDVPEEVKAEAIAWIRKGFNKYTLTQGIPELRQKIKDHLKKKGVAAEEVMVTLGATGGVFLSFLALVDPGDEVLIPDPYFVMYPFLIRLLGGEPRFVNTYPDFVLRGEEVEKQISPRTKVIIINNPNNPTGAVYPVEELKKVAEVARRFGLVVISDDVYEEFLYDGAEHASMGRFHENTVVLNSFSKRAAMTGWRLGYAAGPEKIIRAMINMQQFSYTCAPSFGQKACLVALDADVSAQIEAYRVKRDLIYEGIRDKYDVVKPSGAFYIFPRAPGNDGTTFVERAIERKLFIVPGGAFSEQNTHFRISYGAPDERIIRAIEILRSLA